MVAGPAHQRDAGGQSLFHLGLPARSSMLKKTAYQTELERIEKTIAELQGNAFAPPADTEKVTIYVSSLYQRAALTGDLSALEATESVIDEAIRLLRFPGDLHFLKAKLAFQLHRLADVRRNLNAAPSLLTSAEGRALQADLDFQEGRYQEARNEYQSVLTDNRTWDNLARLAYFEAKLGDAGLADRLYWQAADELTAKEMRSYAWVELQRGLLDLAHGRHDDAAAHYRRADQAYSGYWLVAEHTAELRAAQGELAEAAALYEGVVAQMPRPELQQTLGQIYTMLGRHARAKSCRVIARAAYLQSARRGGVHYYHHLADFYADVIEDGAEAIRWARKDIELRQNFSTQAALAWALYRDGRFAEAVEAIDLALASGVKDAHLFSQAATIYRAAGRIDESAAYLQMAAAINPNHGSFHVHR
jgi:tetratricopeptide (TPR) repeat protein